MSLDVLKQKITQLKHELGELDKSNNPIPELINSTNLLRSNEILSKTNEKKTELLNAYESYFQELDASFTKIKTGFITLKSKPSRKKNTKRKIRKFKRKVRKKKPLEKTKKKNSIRRRR